MGADEIAELIEGAGVKGKSAAILQNGFTQILNRLSDLEDELEDLRYSVEYLE